MVILTKKKKTESAVNTMKHKLQQNNKRMNILYLK